MINAAQCRVLVDFGVPGVPIQFYRAAADVAQQFATEAIRQGLLARVQLDDRVTEQLKQLPYQELFLPDTVDPVPGLEGLPAGHG